MGLESRKMIGHYKKAHTIYAAYPNGSVIVSLTSGELGDSSGNLKQQRAYEVPVPWWNSEKQHGS